jgi:cytochrome P450
MSFRPDRWLSKQEGTNDLGREEMKPIPVGYVPWSIGPRSCPGMKFAKVEFVAVIAHLFRKHRVKAALQPGETMEAVKRQIYDVLEDSSLEVTIKMNHSERVRLVWEEQA